MEIINKGEEIFEKIVESFDPITGEKIETKEKFVYRLNEDTGEIVEKKVINIKEELDKNTGEKFIKAITEEDLKNSLKENINNNINKKKPKKIGLYIIIIICLIVFIAFLISININKEASKTRTLIALKNTIDLTKDEINDVFGIDKFNKTLKSKNYTLTISENMLGSNFNMQLMSNINDKMALNISFLNTQILSTIFDKTDLYISSQILSKNTYKINYNDLENKIDNLLNNSSFTEKEKIYLQAFKTYYFNINKYSNEFPKICKDIGKYILLYLNDIEGEVINNIDKNLKGYRFNIKVKDIIQIGNGIIDTLKNNETFKEYFSLLLFLTSNNNYNNLQEAKEDFIKYLEQLKNELQLYFSKYDENFQFMTIDLFYNRNYIDMYQISIWDNNENENAKFSFIYETLGSYSFKDAKYTFFNYDDEIFEVITNSENTKDYFKFNIEIEDKYNYIGGSFEYNKKTGNIVISDIDDVYFFKGKINKLEPGKELDLYITIPLNKNIKSKLYINFLNTSNIIKPKGNNVKDILNLTQQELIEVIEEIENKISLFYWLLAF